MPIHPHECAEHGMFDVITMRLSTKPDPRCPVCGVKGERRFGVPQLRSNTTYLREAQYEGGQFGPQTRKRYTEEAKRSGVSINGKVYVHGLADYPGDPRAWIDDINDARRILEEKGRGCERLGVKPRQPEAEPQPMPVGQDLVDEEIVNRARVGRIDAGDLRDRTKLAKIRESVRDDITPHYAKPGATTRPLKRSKPNPKGRK